jgi:hypothetical protein
MCIPKNKVGRAANEDVLFEVDSGRVLIAILRNSIRSTTMIGCVATDHAIAELVEL